MRTLRIVNETGMGHDTRVYSIDSNGSETEITKPLTGVDVRVRVGEPNSADLHVLVASGNMLAQLDGVFVDCPPELIMATIEHLQARLDDLSRA